MLKVGGIEPSAIMVGDAAVSVVYRGAELVWQAVKNLWDKDNFAEGFVAASGTFRPTYNASFPNCMYFSVNLKSGQSIVVSGFDEPYGYGRVRYGENGRIVGTVSKTSDSYYTSDVYMTSYITNGTITANKDILLVFLDLNGSKVNDKNIVVTVK